jgi:acetoin utilization deacetylase AcuC-like enzyme
MSLVIARSKRFLDHDPGAWHPERPERLAAIDRGLGEAATAGLAFEELTPRAASREELLSVHDPAHVERLEAARGRAMQIDPDTATSPDSVEVAGLAAGATIDLVRRVAEGRGHTGLALVRPPGHHAIPQRSMGFCLYGNLAVAVKRLLDERVVERVAIYDWDVHHGNGTQAAFYDDPRVLFMSTHQWPFYPGTGAADETGAGDGEGATVNLPCSAGTSEEEILALTTDILAPRVRAFRPDLILVSAGFDGHVRDPIGSFGITTEGFRTLAVRWRELAEELCGGRIAGVLEGGYDLEALSASVRATAEAWA